MNSLAHDNDLSNGGSIDVPKQRVENLQLLSEIELIAPEHRGDIGYLLSDFVLFSLPMRNPGKNVRDWERVNGNRSFSITAGKIRDPKNPVDTYFQIPFGKYARAILLSVCTQAKNTGNPQIELGSSLRNYIETLGFTNSAKSRRAVREQFAAIASMTLVVEQITRAEQGFRAESYQALVAERTEFYFGESDKKTNEFQEVLFPSTMTLTPQFMNALEHSMPVDEKAWALLNRTNKSPLVLDVYTWLCYRLHKCPIDGALVTWEQLAAQFGTQRAEIRFFKRDFLKALQPVLEVYPQAKGNIGQTKEGLILHYTPSPTFRKKLING